MHEYLIEQIRATVLNGHSERLQAIVDSDLEAGTHCGHQWIVLTDRRLILLSCVGDGPFNVEWEASLAEIQEVECQPVVGRHVIAVRTHGGWRDVIICTNARAKAFSELAKRIQEAASNKEGEDAVATHDVGRIAIEIGSDAESIPRSDRKRVIVWALRLIKPQWRIILVLFGLILCSGLLALVPPYLLKLLIDDVLVDSADRLRDFQRIIFALVTVQAAITILQMIQGRIITPFSSHLIHRMRMNFFDAVQRLQIGRLAQSKAGDLVSRLIQDIEVVHVFIMEMVVSFVPQLVIVSGVLIILFSLHWALALLIFVPMPIVVALAYLYYANIRGRYSLASQRLGRLWAKATDSFMGVRNIKLMGCEDAQLKDFEGCSTRFCNALIDAVKATVVFFPALKFTLFIGGALVLYVGGLGAMGQIGGPYNNISLGTLVAMLTYLGITYGPLHGISQLFGRFTTAFSATRRLFEILDARREPYTTADAIAWKDPKGDIRFKNVTFGYVKEKSVLRGINFHAEAGETLGIIGRSGAGKTTIANLIARFYDISDGTIELDGIDIQRLKLEDIRKHVGVLPQDTHLFDATVAENIAMSKTDAGLDEVLRAAILANAHDTIMQWPDAYDTRVGPSGLSLSGGERQLIAIAREILHDPAILILDEATASMDSFTEQAVQRGLNHLMRHRTCLVIAHRLSTLRHADRLMVLEAGRVVELGTPETLMSNRGIFYQHYIEQVYPPIEFHSTDDPLKKGSDA